jgi:hypothetical protein
MTWLPYLPFYIKAVTILAAVVAVAYLFALGANIWLAVSGRNIERSPAADAELVSTNHFRLKVGPLPPKDDPLNPQPKAIQPILFADGHLITQDDIHKAGLCALINSEGRIDSVMQLNGLLPPRTWTVEEWCGASHGARIS